MCEILFRGKRKKKCETEELKNGRKPENEKRKQKEHENHYFI